MFLLQLYKGYFTLASTVMFLSFNALMWFLGNQQGSKASRNTAEVKRSGT